MKKQLMILLLSIGVGFLSFIPTLSALPLKNELADTAVNRTKVKPVSKLSDQDQNGISDGLQSRMASMAASDVIDVIVTFAGPGSGQSRAAEAMKAIGPFTLLQEFRLIHGFKAAMTVGQANALSRSPGVFRVEEDAVVTTQLSGATTDFGAITARTDYSVDGTNIGICIVDTGIDKNHEQFSGRTIAFHDSINGATIAYDDHGHGTHVAAIAMGGGGTGAYANIAGVAPAASIYAAKVLSGSGSGTSAQIIDGLEYCANQTAVDIISMSLGTSSASDGQDSMSLAVNCISDPNYSATCNITPESPKIVVVAAGNSGPAPSSVGSPGAAEKAITAGAVANWSENGKGVYLVAFSSRGPTLDGRIKPDISAPGLRILSARAGTTNGYVSYSGTSMATPFTSGSIALMLEKKPTLMTAAIPADDIRALLTESAQDRGQLELDDSLIKPDNEYGAGLLDVARAVALADGGDSNPTALPVYYRENGTIATNGGSQTFGPFTITQADIEAGIPLAATVTIEAQLMCLYANPDLCNLMGGWIWVIPDLDVYLQDDSSNNVIGGSGDITSSTCPAAGEACGVSRQETIHYLPLDPSAAGDYYIKVVSYDGVGDFLLEVSHGPLTGTPPTPPPVNEDPVASFTEICTGLTCQFTDNSTDDGSISEWNWDFGNNFNSTLQNPEYSFPAAGNYTVSLTVTDNQGATNTASHVVSVTASYIAPVADAGGTYEATLDKGKNIAVVLDGSLSSDSDGSIVSWLWYQGGQQIASGETASVNFKEGTYNIQLTVVDNDGLEGSDATTVTVLPKGGDSSGGSSGPDCNAKPNHPKCQ